MTGDPGVDDPATRAPGGWPTEPERRFARRQTWLARYYDLDVDSRVIGTETAGRIHYLVAGDPEGEPVVLLHGITAPAAIWIPMIPALADRYRVYAPDMPGEGLSAKPSYRDRDLRSFLVAYLREAFDLLGLDRPHAVGNSLGGLQAFLLAIDHDRVDRLCLVGAPVGVSRSFPLPVRLFTVPGINRLLLGAMRLGDPVETARGWLGTFGVVDDSAVPDAFYEAYAARLRIPGMQRSLHSLMTEAGSFGRMDPLTDIREEVTGIDRPTGFVWGTEDYYWNPDLGRALADRMGDAVFHELRDHGHLPWLEPGTRAQRRVRSVLDR